VALQEFVLVVVGIEPSEPAARYSQKRGLKTVNDFFSYEQAKDLGVFDVVHAAMVLEHVADPIGFINDMKKMVKSGGLVAIFCPNDYNPLQRFLRQEYNFQPWWVVPKHHLNYFSVESMTRLLKRLGFVIEKAMGTYPLETFLIAGKNYVGNHELGRLCHGQRKAFELANYKKDPAILNSLYTGLAAVGIGREFMIIARKK
jgi:SAM-dependent methyltransferase